MKNIVTRSLSGIIYVALIVGTIFAGLSWFTALTALFVLLAMIEFRQIAMKNSSTASFILDVVAALALCVLPVLFEINLSGTVVLGCFAVLYPVFRFTAALYDKSPDAFRNAAMSSLAVGYIGLSLGLLNAALCYESDSYRDIALSMFVMIWLNDTGAYCTGSLIGRRKLFERLSPKKSWEGFFGGLTCCIIAGYLCGAWLHLTVFTTVEWVLYGIMVCLFSTVGDLFESLIKRTHSIKDSGRLIPGHGGILDRIDSLLFVAPATFVFLILAEYF